MHPHGSTDSLPYCTMGSGSLAAMAVFEAGYKEDMTRDEAVQLVTRAIRSGQNSPACSTTPALSEPVSKLQLMMVVLCVSAGIYNDLGSGSNVDICVITKGKVDYLRNYEFLQGRTYSRRVPVVYKRGTARKPPCSGVPISDICSALR